MSLDLPNLELIIKLLKMTTAGDAEALVAIRKANEQLRKSGVDWETLLRGKVTIVEDPFKSFTVPEQPRRAPPPAWEAPRAYAASPPPRPKPQPQTNLWQTKPKARPRSRPRTRVAVEDLA